MGGQWLLFNHIADSLHQGVDFGLIFFLLDAAEFDLNVNLTRHEHFFSVWEKNWLGFEFASINTRPVVWHCVLYLLTPFLAQSHPGGCDFSYLNL